MSDIYTGWSSSAEAGLNGVLFQVELEFMVGFCGGRKTRPKSLLKCPKNPRSKEENQQIKLNSHKAPWIEPGTTAVIGECSN